MSKESKRLKEQVLVNSAIASIKKQLDDLEKSRNKYLEAAREARENGIASQYNLAKNAIRIVTAQRTVVEQMLLNLQISAQIKDVSEMTKSFADGMKLLTGAITETAAGADFEKVGKQVGKAVLSTYSKQAETDAFLDSTQTGFATFAAGGGASDDELDRIIADSADSSVDADIAALEQKIKAFNDGQK